MSDSLVTPRSLGRAAALGLAGGLRTLSPLAALRLRARALDGPLGLAALVAAAGELVIDKLPQTPPRVHPVGLGLRAASSATAGTLVSGPAGGVLAAALAMGSAQGGYRARRAIGPASGWPDPLLGAIEDGLAYAVAVTAAGA